MTLRAINIDNTHKTALLLYYCRYYVKCKDDLY